MHCKLTAPQSARAISANTDSPRFLRMPSEIEHSQAFLDLMPPKHFTRHNERIGEEIGVDCGMEDLERSVVG